MATKKHHGEILSGSPCTTKRTVCESKNKCSLKSKIKTNYERHVKVNKK